MSTKRGARSPLRNRRHQMRAMWAVIAVAAWLVLLLIWHVATIKTAPGQATINATSAVFVGFQTLATLALAGLTASYVFTTRDLLDESLAERRERQLERDLAKDDARRRDLDETRRLAYMALLARSTGHVDIAASLVNALVHHQGVSIESAMAHVPTVLNGGDGDYPSAVWLRDQIERINTELG